VSSLFSFINTSFVIAFRRTSQDQHWKTGRGGMDIDSKLRTLCILINLSLSYGLYAIAIALAWFCVRIRDYRVLRTNSI